MIVITVDIVMIREAVQLMGKTCNRCGRENHFEKKCRQKPDSRSPGQLNEGVKVAEMYASAVVPKEETLMKLVVKICNDEGCSKGNQMEDLKDQVQSLFYH